MKRLLLIAAWSALLAVPARADITSGAFAGNRWFGADNALSRIDAAATSRLAPTPTFGIRFMWLPIMQLGVEGELGVQSATQQSGQSGVFVTDLRAHVLWQPWTRRFRPFLLAGAVLESATVSNPLAAQRDVQLAGEAGVGAQFDIGSWWGVRLDARGQAGSSVGAAPVALGAVVTLGFYGRFPSPVAIAELTGRLMDDRDEDGLEDSLDRCPDVAGIVRLHGCPAGTPGLDPQEIDTDGDGVVDAADACSRTVGPVANKGCPWPDSDGDGVLDPADKCPTQAGSKVHQGCPFLDRDGDGIDDGSDKCPDAAGPALTGGCPEVDSDGDGIPDKLDKCPDMRGLLADEGCPSHIPPAVRALLGAVRSIDFAPRSAVLTGSSEVAIREIAVVIANLTDLGLEVSGHTDNTGKPDANRTLSLARAESVKRVLVRAGIAANRIRTAGYGPERPLASNDTDEGRKTNRRVEFKVVRVR